ncbi:hypothetical protein DYD21_11965 [Rhodohalobacter sp. SW132]|nr:hypothetical protein DYD21_11965 [Rhodohalobacter sp. SW132]
MFIHDFLFEISFLYHLENKLSSYLFDFEMEGISMKSRKVDLNNRKKVHGRHHPPAHVDLGLDGLLK